MKRFFSVLLVAILIVTSLATVAAAQVVSPGDTVEIPVTVSGEFANFLVSISADPGLTIQSITGAGASVVSSATSGKANWASAGNVSEFTFYVNVKVDTETPGTYYVSASLERASKAVSMEEDTEDGVANGFVATSVSLSGGSVTIEAPKAPECDHDWGTGVVTKEPTCEEDGVMTYTCTKCSETKTETILATGHSWGDWKYDDTNHWLICNVCGKTSEKEAHNHNIEGDDGYYYCECGHKGDKIPVNTPSTPSKDPNKDDVPKTGDITMQVVFGGAFVLIAMLAVVALVFKRKTAK